MTHKIRIGNREIEADLIDVAQSNEKWGEYLLDDGTVLKIKIVVKKVFRAKGLYDPLKNPVYAVESENVITVDAPGSLRKE